MTDRAGILEVLPQLAFLDGLALTVLNSRLPRGYFRGNQGQPTAARRRYEGVR